MTWPLPQALALQQGVALQVCDFVVEQSWTRATGATAIIEFDAVDSPYLWRIERLVVTTTSALPLGVSVYAGPVNAANLRDATPLPVGLTAIAEYPALLTIPSGVSLTVAVAGSAVGDIHSCSVQYQLVQRKGG